MYLFDIAKDPSRAKVLSEKFNVIVTNKRPEVPTGSGNIDGALRITSVQTDGPTSFLGEFPGNCSSLVLYNIQTFFTYRSVSDGWAEHLKTALNFSIEFCIWLKYAQLFVTVTEPGLRTMLMEEYGFVDVMEPVFNPHSDHTNFFMVKKFVDG